MEACLSKEIALDNCLASPEYYQAVEELFANRSLVKLSEIHERTLEIINLKALPMQHTLSNVRQVATFTIPEGKYPGTWVGTQVNFTVGSHIYVGNTTEHQQKKVEVWVKVKGGCAKVEIKQ